MSTADMPVKAIAPWFGGKRTMAPTIISELGKHASYWEPFCGSMAVLMAKTPSPFETVIDLHDDLINLARVVQDTRLGPMLYRRLRRCWMDEHVFEDARARLQSKYEFREPDLERACYYMLVSWMGMNGVAGTSSYNSGFCARYTKNGGHAGKRWESAVVSIPAWRRRLRRVTVLRRDAFEVLGRIEDAAGVVIYADPPYIKKGAAYVHDFDGIAHHKLATALNRFKATRVVVSYYEDPWLDRLYPLDRWTRVYCATTKAMVSSGRRDGENIAKAPEVLLINGPSFTAPGA